MTICIIGATYCIFILVLVCVTSKSQNRKINNIAKKVSHTTPQHIMCQCSLVEEPSEQWKEKARKIYVNGRKDGEIYSGIVFIGDDGGTLKFHADIYEHNTRTYKEHKVFVTDYLPFLKSVLFHQTVLRLWEKYDGVSVHNVEAEDWVTLWDMRDEEMLGEAVYNAKKQEQEGWNYE